MSENIEKEAKLQRQKTGILKKNRALAYCWNEIESQKHVALSIKSHIKQFNAEKQR